MKGFTLIETIIYIAILAMTVTAFVTFGLSVAKAGSKNQVVAEVTGNGLSAMEIISQKIKSADSVVSPTKGNSGSSIILDMPNTADNITIDVSGGRLRYSSGLSPAMYLTSAAVTVSNLNVTNFARGNRPDNLTYSFTVEYALSGSLEFTYTKDFTTSVSRRK